jgi:hypothetical protein
MGILVSNPGSLSGRGGVGESEPGFKAMGVCEWGGGTHDKYLYEMPPFHKESCFVILSETLRACKDDTVETKEGKQGELVYWYMYNAIHLQY